MVNIMVSVFYEYSLVIRVGLSMGEVQLERACRSAAWFYLSAGSDFWQRSCLSLTVQIRFLSSKMSAYVE